MTNIQVSNIIKIDSRLELLAFTVMEFLKAFGVSDSCLESAKKGVYERQIIEQFSLHFFSGSDYCGRVTIHIDWELYKIYMDDFNGEEIQKDKSLLDQLDKSTDIIIKHVNKIKRDMHITKIKVSYLYIPEYRDNSERLMEAMQYLGHTLSSSSSTQLQNAEFERGLKMVIDKIKELEIIVEW